MVTLYASSSRDTLLILSESRLFAAKSTHILMPITLLDFFLHFCDIHMVFSFQKIVLKKLIVLIQIVLRSAWWGLRVLRPHGHSGKMDLSTMMAVWWERPFFSFPGSSDHVSVFGLYLRMVSRSCFCKIVFKKLMNCFYPKCSAFCLARVEKCTSGDTSNHDKCVHILNTAGYIKTVRETVAWK